MTFWQFISEAGFWKCLFILMALSAITAWRPIKWVKNVYIDRVDGAAKLRRKVIRTNHGVSVPQHIVDSAFSLLLQGHGPSERRVSDELYPYTSHVAVANQDVEVPNV